MDRRYVTRILILTGAMALVTLGLFWAKIVTIPVYTWFGLLYLLLITLLIHAFVRAARNQANSLIRRLMIASILRMFLGILFLAITLYNVKPVNLHFVIFYCLYFCVFLLFEISQMRTNLRPDLKPRPNNENA